MFRAVMFTLLCSAVALPADPKPTAPPKFDGLGTHTRRVSEVKEAQAYFDQGLAFLYAFNHDEALKAFEEAAKLDPDCAMIHWGVAMACGGHINKPVMDPDRVKKAAEATKRSEKKNFTALNDPDHGLLAAIVMRFDDSPDTDQTKRNEAYSRAMGKAWRDFPKDADVGAIYAESLMNLRPWDLWTVDGKPREQTEELVATLEAVLKLNPKHPFALHLYIHALEASPNPDKALDAADKLRDLNPGLGHMVHMPSHIDVRCGRWVEAVEANEKAIKADADYRKLSPKQGFYNLYMAHNHHMLAFAAMQRGQSKKALGAVKEMLAGVPKEWVAVKENAAIADGFLAAPLEAMIRFGMWDEILKEPDFPEMFPIAGGLRHHARGVALAAKGKSKEAREELDALREATKKLPKEAMFGNNSGADLFAVADAMLEGEILAAEGKMADAIKKLAEAVAKEDQLKYMEPPDWIVPVRHALGAFLLKDGQAVEAEKVYRADLKKWPNNGWGLFGLAKSLEMQGKKADAEKVRAEWKKAWAQADITIGSSCLCVPDKER